jgi:molybdopterin molybdotransferase
MVTPEEALATVLECVTPLKTEVLPHGEGLSRTVAQNVLAPLDLPPFNNSAMDGYAVIAANLEAANPQSPVSLSSLETIGAGEIAQLTVTSGTCIKIMTGTPVPAGADAVVMREETRENGGAIAFLAPTRVGQNIRLKGSDVQLGEVVFEAGTLIGAAQWAMLASLGVAQVEVFRRPRVGIVATGAELVAVDAPLEAGQIRDSNSYALRAMVENCGATVQTVRQCGDSFAELETVLREIAPHCDAIITSGGVSAGDFDPVRDVLREHAQVLFWKIAMKPGKPVMFGIFEGKPIFGLPGNPVSVMVAFEEFARPALLKMGGRRHLQRMELSARLEASLRSPEGKVEYVRALVRPKNGEWTAQTHGDQGSGRLSTFARANALLVVPAATTSVAAGENVIARLIDCPEIC